MNLDELQSVQARERQSSDLQHLRSSFYQEVGEYVQSLNEERDELVERAEDPFSAPEVRQLTDDIETAEQTVEAIYERRVGKVVKKASIAAAGMPVDDDGLTDEEELLFEDLVARIERNRETVLSVLDGEMPDLSGSVDEGIPSADPGSTRPQAEPEPGDVGTGGEAGAGTEAGAGAGADGADPTPDGDGVSAADLMGGDDAGQQTDADGEAVTERAPVDPDEDPLAAESDDAATEVPPEPAPPGAADSGAPSPTPGEEGEDPSNGSDPASGVATDSVSADGPGSSAGDDEEADPDDREIPGIPRTTVRITADVGEVVGADDRDYDLGPEDVVTLPEPNADVLVEKDAAERLE